jgi:hypothetical protein
MHDTTTGTRINLREIYARNDAARRIIVNFAAAMPGASDRWNQVERALADVPTLGAIVTRLTIQLAATRLDRANLLAAMRAALGAHADGEADPLSYLRDELDAPRDAATDRRGRP